MSRPDLTALFVCDGCGWKARLKAGELTGEVECPACGGPAWQHPFPTTLVLSRLDEMIGRLEAAGYGGGD